MGYEHHTRHSRSFDEWLADCSTWWDMTRGEEAYDYPWLEWQTWYREGLTVEQAVRRADRVSAGQDGQGSWCRMP